MNDDTPDRCRRRGPSARWIIIVVAFLGTTFSLAILFVTRDMDQAGSFMAGTAFFALLAYILMDD